MVCFSAYQRCITCFRCSRTGVFLYVLCAYFIVLILPCRKNVTKLGHYLFPRQLPRFGGETASRVCRGVSPDPTPPLGASVQWHRWSALARPVSVATFRHTLRLLNASPERWKKVSLVSSCLTSAILLLFSIIFPWLFVHVGFYRGGSF